MVNVMHAVNIPPYPVEVEHEPVQRSVMSL